MTHSSSDDAPRSHAAPAAEQEAAYDRYVLELLQDAEQFYRSNGRLTWTEWAGLSHEQRSVMARARERVQTEELLRQVQAFSGAEGLADVLSVVDEGASLERVKLLQALEHLGRDGRDG